MSRPPGDVRALLVRLSRRHTRMADEAEDLAHDVILSALRRGWRVDDGRLVRAASAATRRHAAFVARTQGRRRAREQAHALEGHAVVSEASEAVSGGTSLSRLSPPLRTTLLLLLRGLGKAELRHLLGLSDAALRKRFQALRARGPLERPGGEEVRHSGDGRRVQVLVILGTSRGDEAAGRVLGSVDPDGHGLVFR